MITGEDRIRAVRAAASARGDWHLVAECDRAMPPEPQADADPETTRAPRLEDTAAPRPARRRG